MSAPDELTPRVALIRLAQYGERGKPFECGNERALYEIALSLLGEVQRLRAVPTRAEVLRAAADDFDRENEDNEILRGSYPGAALRRMADAAEQGEKDTAPAATSTPTASGCVCRTDPADGPAHESHAKWCPASRPTVERIAEIRQGIGDELTRDELHWLSGAASRNEAHIIGARGGHWPLADDLPGVVVLLAQYLAATVAVIERSQPYASTSPSWEKDTREGESTPQPAGTCGRALSTGKPCPDHPVKSTELTVYRASHDSIVMGHYTTREAAREHCETLMHREQPDADLNWYTDPTEGYEDAPEDLFMVIAGGESDTGYTVTALEVASSYDEEADE